MYCTKRRLTKLIMSSYERQMEHDFSPFSEQPFLSNSRLDGARLLSNKSKKTTAQYRYSTKCMF